MAVVGAAPCQCFSPGGIEITSAGMDILNRSALALHPTTTGCDDQGLTERMGMPRGAGTRLERDASARRASRWVCLEQGVDADRAGKPIGRSFAGRL